jgi:hypothetical protein
VTMVVAITGLGITHTGAPLPSERPTWRATASRPGPAIEGREHVADGDSAAQARAKRGLNLVLSLNASSSSFRPILG